MAINISYQDTTLATFTSGSRVLKTAGKYLVDDITIEASSDSGSGGSGDSVTLQAKTNITPTTSSQTITADNGYDGLSSVQINAIPNNYIIPTGTKSITTNGTGIDVASYATVDVNVSSGGLTPTQHNIYLEFTDNTNTTIPINYNDSLIETIITAYDPIPWIYNNKTVSTASLDNTLWYDINSIPIGVELIDYTKCTSGYAVDTNGVVEEQQWSWVSDYTPIKNGMTFSYRNYYWFWIGFYDESKNAIGVIYVMNDGTPDPNDGNTGTGTLSGNKIPSNAQYARLCGIAASSNYISLIRTA